VIDFDKNATTIPHPKNAEVLKNLPHGNPSSDHTLGKAAAWALQKAEDVTADFIGADSLDSCVTFTSGGTESNNTICQHALQSGLCIYTTETEHSSIVNVVEDLDDGSHRKVVWIPLLENGIVDLSFIREIQKGLVFIHHVNSETGVVQPVVAIASILKDKKDVCFAIDAAQSFGRIPIDVEALSLDMLSASGHKLHAFTGVGLLWSQNKLLPLIKGGGQQNKRRSGTQNVLGILSFKLAIEERQKNFDHHVSKMKAIRDYFESQLLQNIPVAKINCVDAERVCNTTSVYFEGVDNHELFIFLDQNDVCVSKGSACLSNVGASSKVITELFGVKRANGTLRFSFSINNTKDEVDCVISKLQKFSW